MSKQQSTEVLRKELTSVVAQYLDGLLTDVEFMRYCNKTQQIYDSILHQQLQAIAKQYSTGLISDVELLQLNSTLQKEYLGELNGLRDPNTGLRK